MSNDEFKCTKDGDCPFDFCVIKNKTGFHKCMYLKISSYVDDEKRG